MDCGAKSCFYKTTYGDTFNATDIRYKPKCHQNPAFQKMFMEKSDAHMLPPRNFPLIPSGPHTPWEDHDFNRVDTKRFLPLKPIVRTPAPKQLLNLPPPQRDERVLTVSRLRQPMFPCTDARVQMKQVRQLPSDVIDAHWLNHMYTSTTARESEDGKIPYTKIEPPMTTFEENADMIKYRPQKYDSSPEDWQKVSGPWDRAQTRPGVDQPLGDIIRRLRPSQLLYRRKKSIDKQELGKSIVELMRQDNLSGCYVMPCPSYAGFRPRSPIEADLDRRTRNAREQAVMKMSYRELPTDEYHILEHAHLGPLSKTVTLTYPYNPYNKVEKKTVSFDQEHT